jgi:hypothetical protein
MFEIVLALEASDPHAVAMQLSLRMGVSFVARESGYWGEYLAGSLPDGGSLQVLWNEDPMYEEGDPEDERFHNAEFKSCGVLIRASLDEEQEAALLECLGAVGVSAFLASRDPIQGA